MVYDKVRKINFKMPNSKKFTSFSKGCNCWLAVKYSSLDLPVWRGLLTSLVPPPVVRSIDLIRFIQIDNPENIVRQYVSHVF